MKIDPAVMKLCSAKWDLDEQVLTAFNGRFQTTNQFFEDLKAYHNVFPEDILMWIFDCDNNGKMNANHPTVDIEIQSFESWPEKTHLIFLAKLHCRREVLDAKYLSGANKIVPAKVDML